MTAVIRKGMTTDSFSHPLQVALNNGLRTQESIHRNNNRLFASDAARCARKAVLHNLISPELRVTTAAAGKLYMGVGSAVHEKFSDAFFNQGILLFKEYRIPNLGLSLGGYIDDIVFIDGHVANVEIKTCGKLPGVIKPDHRAQALVYHAITGFRTYVFYISRSIADWKGSLQTQVLEVIPTPGEVEATIGSILIASKFSKAGFVPNKPAKFESREDCSFCPFVNMCWGDADFPAPDPTLEQRATLLEGVADEVVAIISQTRTRSHGILKHLQTHGTETAKTLLPTLSWDSVI